MPISRCASPWRRALAYVQEDGAAWNDTYTAIVCEELNVKALQFVEREAQLLSYEVLPQQQAARSAIGGRPWAVYARR